MMAAVGPGRKPQPKAKKPEEPTRKVDWSSFTKAELIRTIKSLDARQTKLLNANAKQMVTIEGLQTELDLLKARPVVAATAYGEHDVEDLLDGNARDDHFEGVVHVTQGEPAAVTHSKQHGVAGAVETDPGREFPWEGE